MPCKLVKVSAHPAALSKQGGNSGQSFFATTGNDDRFLDLDVVDGAADEGGAQVDVAERAQPRGQFRLHVDRLQRQVVVRGVVGDFLPCSSRWTVMTAGFSTARFMK